MRRVFTKSDFKKLCHVCGRNCEEDESSATIPITFAWKYEGSTVYLCGSFSQWQVKKKMYRDSEDEPFKLEVCLPPGIYEYKFIVDGVWKYDPYDSVMEDGYEDLCNVIEIMPRRHQDGEEDYELNDFVDLTENQKGNQIPSRIMKIVYQFPAKSVSVMGAWNNWKNDIKLKKDQNNFSGAEEFCATVKLLPGNYHFKFIVDGEWATSSTYPLKKDATEKMNNLLVVPSTSNKPLKKHIDWAEKGTLHWRREESKWAECGKLHHTFQGHSLNVVCDMVYLFGGMANNKFTNTLYMFDPRANEFSLVEDQAGEIPEPRAFHHTSVFGTKIMVYGGYNKDLLNDCYVFDTAINTWFKVAIDSTDEPCLREKATVAPYAGDKLVMFGGYYCSPDMEVEKYLNDTQVLNLSLQKWVKPVIKGEPPKARTAHTANFIKGKMYVFGGMTKQQKNLNDMWMLKTSQSGPFEWKKIEAKGTLPAARHGHSSLTTQNNIVYFGGKGNDQKFYADMFVFDTTNETWIYPKLEGVKPTPRYYHACVSVNKGKEIAIFGGVRPKEFLNYPRMYILETESTDDNELEKENILSVKKSCE